MILNLIPVPTPNLNPIPIANPLQFVAAHVADASSRAECAQANGALSVAAAAVLDYRVTCAHHNREVSS